MKIEISKMKWCAIIALLFLIGCNSQKPPQCKCNFKESMTIEHVMQLQYQIQDLQNRVGTLEDKK